MDETYAARAVILGKQPFRERDSRVTIYSEKTGKVSLVARGTRRVESKLSGHLEPLTLSNLMVVRGRQYDYIGAASNENAFTGIKNDLEKITVAGEAVRIFQREIKPAEKDGRIFDLLLDFLEAVNVKSAAAYRPLLDFFIIKLISALGHAPELFSCVICKSKIKPGGNGFDAQGGGIICFSCRAKKAAASAITDDCVKVLRFVLKNDFKDLIKLDINDKLAAEINNTISSFYRNNF